MRRSAALALAITCSCTAVGEYSKKLANMVQDLATEHTADLSQVDVQVRYVRNLYPASLNMMESVNLKSVWKDGGDLVTVALSQRRHAGSVKLDGTVRIDDAAVEHLGSGLYAKQVEGAGPHKVTLETSSGRTEWQIAPPTPVKISGVNGGRPLDLAQDVTVRLDGAPRATGVTVAVLGEQASTQAALGQLWAVLGNFRPQAEVRVPAAAFANASTNRSLGAARILKGKSTLLVETFSVARRSDGASPVELISSAYDVASVEVTGSAPEPSKGLIASGSAGPSSWAATTQFGYWSRPPSRVKRVAIASVEVNAALTKQWDSKELDRVTHGPGCIRQGECGEIETRWYAKYSGTAYFQKLPEQAWRSLATSLNAGLSRAFKGSGFEVVPLERAIATKAGEALLKVAPPVQSVSDEAVLLTAAGAPHVTGETGLAQLLGPYQPMYVELIDELGVDAVVVARLNASLPDLTGPQLRELKAAARDKFSVDQGTLEGKLEVYVFGRPNGYGYWPTYVAAPVTVTTPAGPDVRQVKTLEAVLRSDAMTAGVTDALAELDRAERDKHVSDLWKDAP